MVIKIVKDEIAGVNVMDKLKEFESKETSEFPDQYDIVNEIKSPFNVLWYNLNFEFIDKYPAKMPEDFARDMLKLYSEEGDSVWDGMCGSGTVPRIANQMGRYGLGTDVNPKAIDLAKRKDYQYENQYTISDIRNSHFNNEIDLVLTSPPFGLNIIGDKNHYSTESGDISLTKTYDEFFARMKQAFEVYYRALKPNGIMIFDARDRTKDKKYYDLAVEFRNLAKDVGFKVLCKYWYFLAPYRQMTYKHAETGYVMPMVSNMEVYVMFKPADHTLDGFDT